MTVALSLVHLGVTLRGRVVLNGVDLQVHSGQIRALVGLNGSGKTTTLRAALGMLRPDAGRVLLHGVDISSGSSNLWRTVGHLVEAPAIYPELTARENIAHTSLLHFAQPQLAADRASQLAAALGLDDQFDVPVRRLSLGTRQKVGLICALAHDPSVVVLDEPTNGLDPLRVVAFRDELRRLAERGTAILLTSHHFDELARVADHVDILHRGRIVDTIAPKGRDLEKAFFETILAADQSAGAPL